MTSAGFVSHSQLLILSSFVVSSGPFQSFRGSVFHRPSSLQLSSFCDLLFLQFGVFFPEHVHFLLQCVNCSLHFLNLFLHQHQRQIGSNNNVQSMTLAIRLSKMHSVGMRTGLAKSLLQHFKTLVCKGMDRSRCLR